MAKLKSIQPQYDNEEHRLNLHYLSSLYKNVSWFLEELPEAAPNSNKRDLALIDISQKEPLLAGVLATVVSRDKNRRWNLTGSARQVSTYTKRLLEVNEGKGWRDFVSKLSTSFYSTNMGFSAEIGIDGTGVPVTMWSFDPTQIRLTGSADKPLEFVGAKGKSVKIREEDAIYANSMPSILHKEHGLGRCAVERSVQVARLALGIFEHDLEKMGAKPPKGILLGKGITRKEFGEAVASASKEMSTAEREVYTNVLALFASNHQAALDIIPFSTLPENWNFKDYVEFIAQCYALEFNYAVSEFWTMKNTNFNAGMEIALETQQTTAKGEIEFSASLQEELSRKFLPNSLTFSFETRSEGQEQQKADLDMSMLDMIAKMYETGLKQEKPMISVEQAQILLAQNGFIPTEWVEGEEDITSNEIRQLRDSLCSNPNFVNRALTMPDEPIVQYVWNADETIGLINQYTEELLGYTFPNGNIRMIAKSSHDFLKNRYY